MLRQLLVPVILAWTAITPSVPAAPAAQPLTAEEIFRPAAFVQADFSPDGTPNRIYFQGRKR